MDTLLLLALSSGEVQLFYESALVNSFSVEPPITAMRFGQYGREDSTLIIVHGRGSLTIKIWRRNAAIDSLGSATGPPPEQDIPLPIPKKTKLYLEQVRLMGDTLKKLARRNYSSYDVCVVRQTAREIEQAADMHRAFQRDLVRLRLETTRAYVKSLSDGPCLVSPSCSPLPFPARCAAALPPERRRRHWPHTDWSPIDGRA